MPLVQLAATREHGNGVALQFSRLLQWQGEPVIRSSTYKLRGISVTFLGSCSPIPALSVLLEDTSHQEWRRGLEAKYHPAERPRRFNFRRVQVTQPMERSATRFSSPIRRCKEALRKSAGRKRPQTKTFHCLLWSAGSGCRQSLRDGAPAAVRAESRTAHVGALVGDLWVL